MQNFAMGLSSVALLRCAMIWESSRPRFKFGGEHGYAPAAQKDVDVVDMVDIVDSVVQTHPRPSPRAPRESPSPLILAPRPSPLVSIGERLRCWLAQASTFHSGWLVLLQWYYIVSL